MRSNRAAFIASSVVMSVGMSASTLMVMQPMANAAVSTAVTVAEPPIQTLEPDAWGPQGLLDQGTIFEGLVGYNLHYQLVPKIAQRWTVSKNGLVWTFYLRKSARFSNGQPVTANDFYYSWMRFVSPQNTQAPIWASAMDWVKNANNFHAGSATANQVGLKVINPYELQMTLQVPHPDLLGRLALASGVALYPPDVKAHPTNWFLPKYFVGDGPYVVSSFTPNGQIDLVRNTHYVGNKTQYDVGNVQQINIVPAPTTPVESYMSNAIDVVGVTAAADYQYIKKNATLTAQAHKTAGFAVNFLAFDKALQVSPLDNILVRKAISMAINRQVIATDVMNGMVQPTTVFGPASWPATKYEHGTNENVKAARALLAKAGHAGGKGIPTLQIYTPPVGDPSIPMAESIAQQLKQNLGINVQIDPTPWSLLSTIIWGGYSKNVKPGYMIFPGEANWWQSGAMDMSAIFVTWYDYPPFFRQYIAKATMAANNPYSVAKYGNPDNPKLGTTWASMAKLQASFIKDSTWLDKFIARQKDPVFRQNITPVPSYQVTWNGYVQAWKAAKTPAEKHAAWVNAWDYIGNGIYCLDLLVWEYSHMPAYNLQEKIVAAHEAADTLTTAAVAGGKLAQMVMNSGWAVPLNVPFGVYLVKPNITNVQYNKFGYGDFIDLQYMKVK